MFSSKKLFNSIVILSLFVIQAGCLKKAGRPSDSSVSKSQTADFRLEPVRGDIIEDNTHETWSFPTQKTYQFTACIIGRNTNQQIPAGQEFQIIKPDGSSIKEDSNNLGCIVWTEPVKFNFTSDSVYLEKVRRIKSVGKNYKGEVTVVMAVNPWMSYRNESGEEVVDMSPGRSKITLNNVVSESDENLLRRGLLNNNDRSARLLIDPDVNIEIMPVRDIKDGKTLKMIMRVTPYLEARNLRGDPTRTDLKRGRYRVYAQLVANYVGEEGKDHALLTPQVIPKEFEVNTSGILSFDLEFDLKREVHTGQTQLALKIEPLHSPYPITHYEGLHNLQKFSSLLQKKSATQIKGHLSSEKFNYAEFIKTAKYYNILVATGLARDLPPVNYDMLDPRFIRIKSGETATERTLMYRVSTQITDSITGEPIKFQRFKIKKNPSNTEEVVTSNEFGIIWWNDELTHLYYQPEKYFFPDFAITQIVSGNTQNYKIAVNPWDFGWTFGVDIRKLKKSYKEMSSQVILPPEFMIDAFRYQTIRFRYEIDEFLTLNVKKAVVMALDPLVERHTINEGRKFEPLRNGIYLVKIALVKYYLDPFENNTKLIKFQDLPKDDPNYPTDKSLFETPEKRSGYVLMRVGDDREARKGQYTTVIKKLLRVQAGRITTPLEFSMRDLRMMSIRSSIMVQLETIDEEKLLRDNIANRKIDELVREYNEARTANMTAEERESFINEKSKEQLDAANKMLSQVRKELIQIKADRELLGSQQQKRDQILSDLEKDLGKNEALKNSEIYKANINLPEDEFNQKMNRARSNLNQLHQNIENYWHEYERSWAQGQIDNQSSDGLIAIPDEHLRKKPEYVDYLASIQNFLNNFDIGSNVNLKDYKDLKTNDYSNNPIIPLVDLDLYVEHKSGLRKRTFIGPCTLVENDNMSELRPTDKIDEALSGNIDSSQSIYTPLNPPADNREFEFSEYHDSLSIFKDRHVDDFIEIHIENEKNYEREMEALSQMGRFTHSYNLEYVSLTDQPLKIYKQGCSFVERDNCFVSTTENVTKQENFIESLNKVPEDELLAHYFFVRPYSLSKKINKEISEENSLESLLDRTKRTAYNLFLSNENNWKNEAFQYYSPGNLDFLTAQNFINRNYPEGQAQSNTQTVSNWLRTGAHNLNLIDAIKICSVLTQQISNQLLEKKLTDQSQWQKTVKTPEEYLLEKCFSQIHFIDDESINNGFMVLQNQVNPTNKPVDRVIINGINFDRRYKVLKTGSYEHKAGKNTNIIVGADFGVGSYQDINTASNLGLNQGALLGLPAVGIGAYAGLAAAGIVAAPPIALTAVAGGLAALGGLAIWQDTNNKAEGVNLTNTSSVNMSTYLVVQQAEMEIIIERHEKCLSFQFTPDLINDLDFKQLHLSSGINHRNPELRKALERGFFICEGKVTNTPELVNENFYYITQHFTAGDMLDNVNLLNHVWLLALRGDRDFNTFIRILKAREVNSNGEEIETEKALHNYALSRLTTVYNKVLPSFPGMYSVIDPLPIRIPPQTIEDAFIDDATPLPMQNTPGPRPAPRPAPRSGGSAQ